MLAELRQEKVHEAIGVPVPTTDVEQYFKQALSYVESAYLRELSYYRKVRIETVTPDIFWNRYVWHVYRSGYNKDLLVKMFDQLLKAIGPYNCTKPYGWAWARVQTIQSQERKCKAVCKTREYLVKMGWDSFKQAFCKDEDTLAELPFIAKASKTKFAQDIGIDCIRVDYQINFLTKKFQFDDPESLCQFVSAFSGENLVVSNFILRMLVLDYGSDGI